MPKGMSIHIGLNLVDPVHYQGWDGALGACEADAKDMYALAKKQGFQARPPILTRSATAQTVIDALTRAAEKLEKGDILFVTYSGHGGQTRDRNGDEGDEMDETWVLFDRQLVDDEIYKIWGKFRSGVRILVLSDSCHSGSVTRDVPDFIDGGPRRRIMPGYVRKKVDRKQKKLYEAVQKRSGSAENAKIGASVLLISGCMDNQYSLDGERNGAFTGALKSVWKGGGFKGNYRNFRDRIRAKLPNTQSPNYFFIGAPHPKFEAQTPFTV